MTSRVLSVPPATLTGMDIVLPLMTLLIGLLVGAIAALVVDPEVG